MKIVLKRKRVDLLCILFSHQVTVRIGKQGQKTVEAKIQQQFQESIMIKPDQTILIDGMQAKCSQKGCQSKQGGATVAKVKTSDGKTQIQLSTTVRISFAYYCP